MRAFLAIVILCCFQVFVSGQYAIGSYYENDACFGDVAYFGIVELGACINDLGNTSSMTRQESTNMIYIYDYNASYSCSGPPTNRTGAAVGQCMVYDITLSVMYNLTASPVAPVLENAYQVSMYENCTDSEAPMLRIVYNPMYCFTDSETTSYMITTCNTTAATQQVYKSTNCTGPYAETENSLSAECEIDFPILECFMP